MSQDMHWIIGSIWLLGAIITSLSRISMGSLEREDIAIIVFWPIFLVKVTIKLSYLCVSNLILGLISALFR